VTTEAAPIAIAPVNLAPVSAVGVRTFAQINSSLSKLTGVPTTNAAVMQTYTTLQQQLPSDPTIESFSSANQVGIIQLAVQYCNAAVTSNPGLFGTTLTSSTFGANGTGAGTATVSSALAAKVLGTGLTTQPAAASVTDELNKIIGKLCTSSPCTSQARVQVVAAAACAAAFGSADMLIN
jgi:hypothetical protein